MIQGQDCPVCLSYNSICTCTALPSVEKYGVFSCNCTQIRSFLGSALAEPVNGCSFPLLKMRYTRPFLTVNPVSPFCSSRHRMVLDDTLSIFCAKRIMPNTVSSKTMPCRDNSSQLSPYRQLAAACTSSGSNDAVMMVIMASAARHSVSTKPLLFRFCKADKNVNTFIRVLHLHSVPYIAAIYRFNLRVHTIKLVCPFYCLLTAEIFFFPAHRFHF